jgi:cytochrome c-type biogenesis protein CcmE
VAQRRSPARLIVALSVAAVLAVFLLYTSIAGGGTPSLSPSELAGRSEKVSLSGQVIGPISGDPRGEGLRFALRDIEGDGATTVRVLYRGSVPDQFKLGRDLVVDGRLRQGTFVAVPGTMVTKCPSKYTAKPSE